MSFVQPLQQQAQIFNSGVNINNLHNMNNVNNVNMNNTNMHSDNMNNNNLNNKMNKHSSDHVNDDVNNSNNDNSSMNNSNMNNNRNNNNNQHNYYNNNDVNYGNNSSNTNNNENGGNESELEAQLEEQSKQIEQAQDALLRQISHASQMQTRAEQQQSEINNLLKEISDLKDELNSKNTQFLKYKNEISLFKNNNDIRLESMRKENDSLRKDLKVQKTIISHMKNDHEKQLTFSRNENKKLVYESNGKTDSIRNLNWQIATKTNQINSIQNENVKHIKSIELLNKQIYDLSLKYNEIVTKYNEKCSENDRLHKNLKHITDTAAEQYHKEVTAWQGKIKDLEMQLMYLTNQNNNNNNNNNSNNNNNNNLVLNDNISVRSGSVLSFLNDIENEELNQLATTGTIATVATSATSATGTMTSGTIISNEMKTGDRDGDRDGDGLTSNLKLNNKKFVSIEEICRKFNDIYGGSRESLCDELNELFEMNMKICGNNNNGIIMEKNDDFKENQFNYIFENDNFDMICNREVCHITFDILHLSIEKMREKKLNIIENISNMVQGFLSNMKENDENNENDENSIQDKQGKNKNKNRNKTRTRNGNKNKYQRKKKQDENKISNYRIWIAVCHSLQENDSSNVTQATIDSVYDIIVKQRYSKYPFLISNELSVLYSTFVITLHLFLRFVFCVLYCCRV